MSSSAGLQVQHLWSQHTALLVLLAVSWCVRIVIVLGGGQLYWPDEGRYFRSLELLSRLAHADPGGTLDVILQKGAHPGFSLVASFPAVVQTATTRLLGWSVENTLWIPALVLSLASVVCIGLTYAIARKAGAGEEEALLAAFLMACASTIFFYARHLLPYDSSMALVLLTLWIGMDTRPGVWRSLVCGLVAGLAFLTYYGYWAIALTVVATHVLYGKHSAAEAVKRAIAAGLGLGALPALRAIASLAWGAKSVVVHMGAVGGSVTQGDFAEGWRLPWAYLWHAEHGLLLVWAIGVGAIVWLSVTRCQPVRARGLLWLGAAATIYLLLAVSSTGLAKIVVYGRVARQMVPFLCLLTACSMTYLAGGWWLRGRRWLLVTIVLAVQTALNFAQPLLQQWPTGVERFVAPTYGHVGRDGTFPGPRVEGVDGNDEMPQPSRYILLNAQRLYPVRGPKAPPAGDVVLRLPHPLQFLPYQYEGSTPRARLLLRSTDISMRLIDTQAGQGTDSRGSRGPR